MVQVVIVCIPGTVARRVRPKKMEKGNTVDESFIHLNCCLDDLLFTYAENWRN